MSLARRSMLSCAAADIFTELGALLDRTEEEDVMGDPDVDLP